MKGYFELFDQRTQVASSLLKCPWARYWVHNSLLYLWKQTEYSLPGSIIALLVEDVVVLRLCVHVGRSKEGRAVTVSTSQISWNVTSVSCTQHTHVYQPGWSVIFFFFFLIPQGGEMKKMWSQWVQLSFSEQIMYSCVGSSLDFSLELPFITSWRQRNNKYRTSNRVRILFGQKGQL